MSAVKGLLVAGATLTMGDAWCSEAAEPGFSCAEVMVEMRDQVELATDVYIPSSASGPFPTIVKRTPYGKNECADAESIYLAQHGYAVVTQDERGRHRSKGEYYWYKIFKDDGHDAIEWAATQQWSTGKVGTLGTSFLCVNQYTMLPSQPPHLVAAFCTQAAANPYKYAFYQGGALQMIMPTWLLGFKELARPNPVPVPDRGYAGSNEQWLTWLQHKQNSTLRFGESMLSDMARDMVANPHYNDYWKQFAANEQFATINVPVLHFASTYDRYPSSQVEMFKLLQDQGMDGARGRQQLVMGPWVHGSRARMPRVIGDLDFGADAAIDYHAVQLRWFDFHLKGVQNGVDREAPVRVFVMGANEWRYYTDFPPRDATQKSYYLGGGPAGSINSLNDGRLTIGRPGQSAASSSYEYDPLKPLPTIGGDHFTQPAGARDHRPVDRKSLTFTSSILEEDVEIIGAPVVEFYGSSTGVDTDWVVTVSDVHPDGYSQHLRQNLLRARFRESWDQPVLMTPGDAYPFSIEMYPIANRFKKGHRIRLTLSSSSFPKWYPNGNTGQEMDGDIDGIRVTNTIYHDDDRPSRVVMHVMPRKTSSGEGAKWVPPLAE